MSARRATSFWRTSLSAELLATATASLLLAVGAWITVRQLEQNYLAIHRDDAERMDYHLREHLAEGVQQLEDLAQLPQSPSGSTAVLLAPSFSDLYRIDRSQRVRQVLEAVPGSRVFEGFSFAGSQIQPYLALRMAAGGADRLPSTSPITRGLEDERSSVYVSRPLAGDPDQWLLGRLNLNYIESFLRQFSRFSGTPVLLVTNDGFVMLASENQPRVPTIDLSIAATSGGPMRPMQLEGRRWLPQVAPDTGLGARMVTLVPLDPLERQQQAVLLAAGVAAALIALVLLIKILYLRRHLFAPVSRFASQLQELEQALRSPTPQRVGLVLPSGLAGGGVAGDYEEIERIRVSFAGLMQLISQRDQTLQRQLRTSLSAAAIVHEISVPLSSIRLLCQLADRQLGSDGGPLDVGELVANLQSQSDEVNRVEERMRMLLRNANTELLPTDLSAVASSACVYVKHLLREQRVQLHCEGLEQGPALVQGDAAQLQTAITNLLRNAMEAVASQPVAQRRLELALQRRSAVAPDNGGDASGSGRHDELVLRIADSGPGFGFDPSDETLFQSTKPAGSGLGLYVVRTTVANHHGRLEVRRSARHGGAEVSLVLPAAPQQTPLAGHTQAEDPGFDAARLRGKLIDQQPQRQADQPSGR